MALFGQQAVKEKLKARIAIDGPTGSGKTWTGMQAARILAGAEGRIGVVDTEGRSAAYYAPSAAQLAGLEPTERVNWWDAPYVFGHMPWSPPYDPRVLADIIIAAGNEPEADRVDVLLIDSLTHFYAGEGGTLDIVDNAANRSFGGNKYSGWMEGTPAQRHLLDTIIHAPFHVVTTMRSKMEYVLEEGANGKKSPRKIGMAPEQRAGIEYEFTVVCDMDLEHRMVVSKSRCSLVADLVAPQGRSAEVFAAFAGWLDSGVERISVEHRKVLAQQFARLSAADVVTLREAMQAKYGRSTEITTDQYPEALAWLTERVDRMTGTTTPPAPVADPEPAPADEPAQQDDSLLAGIVDMVTDVGGRLLNLMDGSPSLDHPDGRCDAGCDACTPADEPPAAKRSGRR